jgi:thioredoxin-dependent peroxiredoxin
MRVCEVNNMPEDGLAAGMAAPGFCLKDAYEDEVCLKEYAGRWTVLYFYPKDNTPGCTLEAMDFSDLKGGFEGEGATVLGVSSDSCRSHQDFIDKRKLTIRLLSDPDAAVHKAYGVWKPKKFLGKEFLGTVRTTFIIGPGGNIARVWPKVDVRGHAKDVLDGLRALRAEGTR